VEKTMYDVGFQFSKITNMEVATFDNSLSSFYSNGIEGTIKEDIQNALDARLPESELPVKLVIGMHEVNKSDLPGIDHVFDHINSLKGSNDYTIKTIEYMKNRNLVERVPVLTIEDQNTKGLTGAANGQSNNKKDTFGIYAYSKGVHFVESDANIETTRGGSHGIGKIANNAASDIHLMYFANCDADGHQHVGGTVQLIEHALNNQFYRSTGYFSTVNEESNKYFPYENKFTHPIFNKESRGLKIIIPYIRKEFFNEIDIIHAICDNFFMAILKNNLEVVIQNGESTINVTNETLDNIITTYYETDLANMKKVFTPLYLSTYQLNEPQKITISNGSELFEFDLYFRYDENIISGRVAIIRTIGMKIEDFKVRNSVRKPFNAILIGGQEEDKYLKSLENESHTQISAEAIRDEKEKRKAKKFINNLHKEINQIINNQILKNNPTDGTINTDDLIYQTETTFKNELSDRSKKIKLSTNKTVVKKVSKERRDSDSRKKINNLSTAIEPKSQRRAIKKQSGNSSNDKAAEYIIPPNTVERISLNNKEIIRINLTGLLKEQPNYCNLSIRIIDGMGKELDSKYDLKRNYSTVVDLNTRKSINFDNEKFSNVSVYQNLINLQLNAVDYRNNSELKFLYEVEVENDI